ncbi:alpha/beta fold hydrolase [Pedobacter sp. 22226]|uniref:alpha/beta fold hydrolase n=1 Tax=Pedobacter sp. 22226 TaxID=3453894 RepID=UPI003F87F33C
MKKKLIFKLIISLFFATICEAKAQIYNIVQAVNVDKYKGKNFKLKGKVYYKDILSKKFQVFLMARSGKDNFFNPSDLSYKANDWSNYELSGKISKKGDFLYIGVQAIGTGSFYLDDFKLFITDDVSEQEVQLRNGDFEENTLSDWRTIGFDKGTKFAFSNNKHFAGKQSLFIDNGDLKAAPGFGDNPEYGKYIELNGVKLYYEIYGKGEPLILLHGNNLSMVSFSNQLEVLSKKYMVIGLDSRGQGKSTPNNEKLTYEVMAEDVNTLLDKLNLKKVNVLGWSDGGNIALILALHHPDKVKKMAIMGTVLYNDETSVVPGINLQLRKEVKEMEDKGIPKSDMNYRLKILLLTEPHVNPDSLKNIKAKVLVMAGQHDIITEKHTKLIAQKIPNSKLIIFKGADHEAPSKIPEIFNRTIMNFFESEN